MPTFILAPASAMCIRDEDWPEAPCLDTPPYTQAELQEAWAPYYDYKGSAWMEMKKAEMDQAAKDGTLMEWRERQSANDNVYQYYKAFDQAPHTIIDSSRDRVRVTYWYSNPNILTTIAAVAGTGAIAAFIVFRKTRRESVK